MSEFGYQRSEVRSPNSEVRSRKSEVGNPQVAILSSVFVFKQLKCDVLTRKERFGVLKRNRIHHFADD